MPFLELASPRQAVLTRSVRGYDHDFQLSLAAVVRIARLAGLGACSSTH